MKLSRGTRLVLATHNRGKLREMRDLLAPRGIELVSAGELGLAEPVETETTFIGNATLKAVTAAIQGAGCRCAMQPLDGRLIPEACLLPHAAGLCSTRRAAKIKK